MLYKILLHKTKDEETGKDIYGVLENQEVHISAVPDLMQQNITTDDIVYYVQLINRLELADYQLCEVEITIKNKQDIL